MASKGEKKKKVHPLQQLIAGGCSGFVEASVCHPLDTIKTRMQLRRQTANVENVVVKMKNSLVEPALRLRHSLAEPTLKPSPAGALHDPGLRLTNPQGAAGSATVVMKGSSHLHSHTVQAPLGPIGTARRIVEREGFFALYKVSLSILHCTTHIKKSADHSLPGNFLLVVVRV